MIALRRTLALGLLVTALPSCAQKQRDCTCDEVDAGNPVEVALVSFLSRARSAHHAADAHETAGDRRAAVNVLETLLGGPLPENARAAEVREVLADTHGRVGQLKAELDDFAGAEASVAQGLALVSEPSYFRGHLFEVRGLVAERHGKALAAAGDQAGAAREKSRALEAFEEAMRIQARVIEQTTEGR
jgi:hypothetical protein